MAFGRSLTTFATFSALAMLAAACGSDNDTAADPVELAVSGDSGAETDTETSAPTPTTVSQIASSPVAVTISGLDAVINRIEPSGLPEPAIDIAELRAGGPPPDGIPPIDKPKFVTAQQATELADSAPVLALEVNGVARAYPVAIMTWHEIVNDTLGDVPVAVTYCPLCNSAIAYDRRLPAAAHDTVEIVDFGTSGMLWRSSLVMYDRQTETLWSHFTGAGIVGELTGVELGSYPVQTVGWATWRDAHPDGLVLSRDTGFNRDYGRNPYPGYGDIDGTPFLFEGQVDGRFTAMTRMVGFELGEDAFGVDLQTLEQQPVIAIDDAVVLWQNGATSALETERIEDGRDVGQTGVFSTIVDNQKLTFTAVDNGFTDDQTGSRWNILGHATDGPLAGTQLDAIEHVDTFWFAWSTFHPDVQLPTLNQ